jgi:hypothetical protein
MTGPESPSPGDAAAVPNDDGATVALLLSVVGLLGCLPVGAAGLAMGYLARERIRAAGGALGGERTAYWAVVIGWVAVAVSVVALIGLLVAYAVTGRG